MTTLRNIMEPSRSRGVIMTKNNNLEKKNSLPFHPCLWRMMLCTLVMTYSSYTILVHKSKVDNTLPYSSTTVILCIEACKLFSSLLFLFSCRTGRLKWPSFATSLPFCVPALLYFINNNSALHMQQEMDSATYQVLGNMKILTTAILYRLVIKRPISGIQWLALLLLMVAGMAGSYGGLVTPEEERSSKVIHISVKGIVMLVIYCCISGLAGVYSEYILKDKYEMSLHMQNSLLYVYGIILNGMAWLVSAWGSEDVHWNVFHGFNSYTWLVVLTQAAGGLLMSSVMKHGSNIIRLFVISSAMLVTIVLSTLILDLQLNLYICFAFVFVVIAIALYYKS